MDWVNIIKVVNILNILKKKKKKFPTNLADILSLRIMIHFLDSITKVATKIPLENVWFHGELSNKKQSSLTSF